MDPVRFLGGGSKAVRTWWRLTDEKRHFENDEIWPETEISVDFLECGDLNVNHLYLYSTSCAYHTYWKKIRLVVCIFSLAILVSDLQKTLMALGPLSHAYSNKLPRWIMVRDCWRCLYFKWSRFTRTDERYMWPTDPNFRRRRRRWGYGVGKESDWKVDSSLWFFQIDGQKVGCIILDSYS